VCVCVCVCDHSLRDEEVLYTYVMCINIVQNMCV